jgi:hypothetical protein
MRRIGLLLPDWAANGDFVAHFDRHEVFAHLERSGVSRARSVYYIGNDWRRDIWIRREQYDMSVDGQSGFDAAEHTSCLLGRSVMPYNSLRGN